MRRSGNGEAQWTRTQGVCLLQGLPGAQKGFGLGQALPPELLSYRVLSSPTRRRTRYQGLSDSVVPTCLFLLPPFILHLLCLISPLSTFLLSLNNSCIFFSLFFSPLASSLLYSHPLVFSHLKASHTYLFPFFLYFSCCLAHLQEGVAKHLVGCFSSFGVTPHPCSLSLVFHTYEQVWVTPRPPGRRCRFWGS